MRAATATRSTVTGVSAVLALLLLCANALYAAPAATRRAGSGAACSQRTSQLRKTVHHLTAKSPRPIARPSVRLPASLLDLTTVIKRGLHPTLPDDDEAIQNDAPAARIDVDQRMVAPLLPLGVLQGSFDRRLTTHRFSPRSPRGPPTSA
jgi:hypothetical protein